MCMNCVCLGDQKDKMGESEKKRLKGCTQEEVLAVLGHELGHWKMWHIPKNFVISALNTFLCFAVFAYLYQKKEIYEVNLRHQYLFFTVSFAPIICPN